MKLVSAWVLFASAVAVTCLGANDRAGTSPILMELFTSEGCSSCPPVDSWIKQLDATQPVPGAQLIVLSEHVDYWNHDGWKDPYSSSSLTERQSAYSHVLKASEVYTPQVIVDGTAELRLSDPQRTSEIFQKAASSLTLPVHISSVSVEGNNPSILRARIETDASSEKHNADVFVAIALDHADSEVLHGENSGKHLAHVAVVQSLKKLGKLKTGESFGMDFQTKLTPGTDTANIRLVAFVQESGPGRVLGATMRKPPLN